MSTAGAQQYFVIPLSVQKDGDDYLVGNAEMGDFYQFPEQGVKPNFNSLAEKVQPYQRCSFLGTTLCGAGWGSLNRPLRKNRGKPLIFGVPWGEMPSSALNANTLWPSRSR